MDHFEVKRALASMVILVDTREQDTPRLRKRLRAMACPYERHKLEFGDYSAKCTLPDGGELDLSDTVSYTHLDVYKRQISGCFSLYPAALTS